jgi:hypothetical protein
MPPFSLVSSHIFRSGDLFFSSRLIKKTYGDAQNSLTFFLFFHLQRTHPCGWSEIASQVALTYTASVIVGLAAQQAGRSDLIRSPKRVFGIVVGSLASRMQHCPVPASAHPCTHSYFCTFA